MAEADAIVAVGNAEADRMKMKAAVYKKYGQAATMSMVLDALPKVIFRISLFIKLFKCTINNFDYSVNRSQLKCLLPLQKQMRLF